MEKIPKTPEGNKNIIDLIDKKIREGVISDDEQGRIDQFYRENPQYGLSPEKEIEEKESHDIAEPESDEEISVEEKEEIEKTPEEVNFDIDKTRTEYVNACNEYRKEFGGMKEKDLKNLEKTIELARKQVQVGDSAKLELKDKGSLESIQAELRKQNFISMLEKGGEIGFTRAQAIYETELKKTEYEAAKIELGKKLSEQGVEKAEIFKQLILNERELLNQAKIESWPPKEKNIFRKVMELWMKQGTAKRLLYSTVLLGGLAVGASFAGIPGAAVAATALFNPSRFIRIGGGLTAGHLIRAMGGKIERWRGKIDQDKTEAALSRLREGLTPENLKTIEGEFEKILEEQQKRARKRRLYVGIASAVAGVGGSIGAGMLEHAWAGGIKVAPETMKPGTHSPEELKPGASPEALVEKPLEIETVVEAQKGDSVWKLAEKQLESKGYFKGLTGSPEEILAKKRYLIDAIKDKIAENPQKFGISSGDADLIRSGEKIDFSSIFEDKEDINSMIEKVGGLKSQDIENILHFKEPVETIEVKVPVEESDIAEGGVTESGIEEHWAEAGKKVEYIDETIPKVESTEQIFVEVSPTIGRQILTEKLYDYFGMWSGTYDKFSDLKLRDFFNLDSASGRRIIGAPWEDYDYNKFSPLQNKIEKVYNLLDSNEKNDAAKKSVETFIKKYFVKIFSEAK